MKNYTFLKALDHAKYANMQISNNLIFNEEKLKMGKFPFFRKTCAIRFLMSQAFQKAKFYQNLTSESGSKEKIQFVIGKSSHSGSVPEESGSQYKSPVLYLKGGLWVFNQSGEGGQFPPLPAGIGLIEIG